jgi:hypothetical protein
MIGLRQGAKSSPDALGRSAGVISFLPLQRIVLASRPRQRVAEFSFSTPGAPPLPHPFKHIDLAWCNAIEAH